MARPKKTKTEKLINELIVRGPMTHKQIVKFLLRGTGKKYNNTTRKYYDGMLYGRSLPGFFDTHCDRRVDGLTVYYVFCE